MTNIFEFLANRAIEEAIRDGNLDNIEGKGQPLKDFNGTAMDNYLRANGHVPREVMLRKKLQELQAIGGRDKECRSIEMEIRILVEQRLARKNPGV